MEERDPEFIPHFGRPPGAIRLAIIARPDENELYESVLSFSSSVCYPLPHPVCINMLEFLDRAQCLTGCRPYCNAS